MSKFLQVFAEAFDNQSLIRVEHDTLKEGPRVRVGRVEKLVAEKDYLIIALDASDEHGSGAFRSVKLSLVTSVQKVE